MQRDWARTGLEQYIRAPLKSIKNCCGARLRMAAGQRGSRLHGGAAAALVISPCASRAPSAISRATCPFHPVITLKHPARRNLYAPQTPPSTTCAPRSRRTITRSSCMHGGLAAAPRSAAGFRSRQVAGCSRDETRRFLPTHAWRPRHLTCRLQREPPGGAARSARCDPVGLHRRWPPPAAVAGTRTRLWCTSRRLCCRRCATTMTSTC